MKIYYKKNEKNYYLVTDKRLNCDTCKVEIKKVAVIKTDYFKKESIGQIYCIKCAKKSKLDGIISEKKIVLVTKNPPKTAFEIVLLPPNLQTASNLTVFEAAELKSEQTVDRTVYVGKELIEGATIDKFVPYDKKQDKLISEKEFTDRLDLISSSVHLIDENKIKKIEKKIEQ